MQEFSIIMKVASYREEGGSIYSDDVEQKVHGSPGGNLTVTVTVTISAPLSTPVEQYIGATIRIGREIRCLPYAGFFSSHFLPHVGKIPNF